jgi:hypothetical protein
MGGPDDTIEGPTVAINLRDVDTPDVSGPVAVRGIDTAGYVDARGIRVCRDPDRIADSDSGPRIVNCEVSISDLADRTSDSGLIARAGAIRGAATALETRIESCRVRSDIDGVPAIRFDRPAAIDVLTGDPDTGVETDVIVRASAAIGDADTGAAVVIRGREGAIDESCIERPGQRLALDADPAVTIRRTRLANDCSP